ncbi:MAG: dihydroxy-acid dehydratase [Oligoflexus sp.]
MKPIRNHYSQKLTGQRSQGASQAMLLATGLKSEDLPHPFVGIGCVWWDGNPCNMHLAGFGERVQEEMKAYQINGIRFHTVGVSDGISMGTSGMSYSLPSRELIADSIETMISAHWYDGFIGIPGCDKNLPACAMALGRLNRPGLLIYGGTIKPGCLQGQELDVVSAFQSYGQWLNKEIDDEQRQAIVNKSCPGAGACGGMYTANTMAAALEAMGLMLPYSSSTPAEDPGKLEECRQAAKAMDYLLSQNLKPRDILTRKSLENGLVAAVALGGSTNAVLHFLAIAKSFGLAFDLDDIQNISNTTPLLADMKPSGRYRMADLHRVGGTPAVLKYLWQKGLFHGDAMTVLGKPYAEILQDVPDLAKEQTVVYPVENALRHKGHIAILKGNLAPKGSVAKITGKEGEQFSGPAIVFDSEEDMLRGLEEGRIAKGHVVIIRYEGPKGGPGMPEMLTPTSALVGAGMHQDVALITDGRFSGGSHGFIIGHVTPEAQEGGPIALVEDGDEIVIDVSRRSIEVKVTTESLDERARRWNPPPAKVRSGYLGKYVKLVSDASQGCVTDQGEL